MRALIVAVLLTAACGDDMNNNNNTGDMAMSMVPPDLTSVENPDLAPACFMNPMTHLELINACTDADSVDKTPYYPALAPNGQLPPLP